jgi:hypothetical protein
MDTDNEIREILRIVGRIEGQLIEICKLPERVSRVEQWQSWLRGAWAALAGALAWLWSGSCGK